MLVEQAYLRLCDHLDRHEMIALVLEDVTWHQLIDATPELVAEIRNGVELLNRETCSCDPSVMAAFKDLLIRLCNQVGKVVIVPADNTAEGSHRV